ncbi:MAG TPA: agmatinase [Pseudomonadota bacterium]|nr:agmatinase [Pseudomonadota bacterium]HQX23355.1 agmatinase [Pseudomonadota bacterium]HQY35682.1 agmatinase [Pseudomonadota bacterium]HRA36938.1 agmatinase [Pseudomonadota bacterium]
MAAGDSHTPARTDLALVRESDRGTLAEPTWSGVTSFMRRRYRKALDGVDVAVVGMPYDLATTNRPGARLGPRAMRAASASLAWAPPYAWGFDPFERLVVVDHGDVLVDHGHPGEVPAAITAAYARIVAQGVVPLTLGGDHYVSYPILRALHGRHGPLALVHFDAHSDTWREEGERIDHGSMFFHAARHGYVDPARSIQLGMRTHNPETHGYEVRDARWLHRHGVEAAIERIRARVAGAKCYVSFDIDFLDPSAAPGTGTPVVGGFSTHVALELVRGLAGLDIVGMDVVEVSPPYDHAEMTALAGASIAHELLAAHASRFGERRS